MGEKRRNGRTGAFIAIGLGAGAALGIALDSIGIGLALGLAAGLALSWFANRRSRESGPQRPPREE